jgi:hypothetical protein
MGVFRDRDEPQPDRLDDELVAAVRDAYAQPPADDVAAEHLAAMTAAARDSVHDAPARVPVRRARRGILVRVATGAAAAVVALTAGTAGLAVAGVDLPDAAKAPFDTVGIDLPNQDDDAAATPAEQRRDDARERREARERGCERALARADENGRDDVEAACAGVRRDQGGEAKGKGKRRGAERRSDRAERKRRAAARKPKRNRSRRPANRPGPSPDSVSPGRPQNRTPPSHRPDSAPGRPQESPNGDGEAGRRPDPDPERRPVRPPNGERPERVPEDTTTETTERHRDTAPPPVDDGAL